MDRKEGVEKFPNAAGNFSRGIFHLYATLPLCYDVPVLKALSI